MAAREWFEHIRPVALKQRETARVGEFAMFDCNDFLDSRDSLGDFIRRGGFRVIRLRLAFGQHQQTQAQFFRDAAACAQELSFAASPGVDGLAKLPGIFGSLLSARII